MEEARKEFVESAFRTMRLAAKQAAEKIVKHIDCTDEKVSLRAAEDVIEFAKARAPTYSLFRSKIHEQSFADGAVNRFMYLDG